ncbi:RpiB/LacA/LacB family sugar-phosphate isomerase [Patescibacteria group bacterium]|nr:RpiB/LacA/LacB family sugar-phosphate isomerase [Patescibacteria group bacterium]MBU1705772.1 RpiB/LacA/LacB family sugar-phosphate isomerase [Patescibacteria group bacterium]
MNHKPPIFIGADHAGWELKQAIKKYFFDSGYDVTDFGNLDLDPNDDYPDFALAVAQNVAAVENARGFLFCGSAQGMVMCANKVKGIRAALGWSINAARSSRRHNDANILCLPARDLALSLARQIVDLWLFTPKSSEERHARRVQKIAEYEAQQTN